MFAALRKTLFGDPREKLLDALGEAPMPTFPQVANAALDKLRDPTSSLRDVGLILEQDPGLSIRLLKTVNSPAFGLRRPCTSVAHAASLMGRAQLESMVLAVAVNAATPKKAPGFNRQQFWQAAAQRAAVARSIAAAISPRFASEAFTAGLLQDMAVPLLAARRSDYAPVLEAWRGGEGSLDALEQQAFGWDHAEIGGLLGERWEFPAGLKAAVSDHHGVDADPAVGVVALIGEDGVDSEKVIEQAHARFGLAHDVVDKAIQEGSEQAQTLSALWT
ncbi:MAG: HDOD domain-containing protein [Myxococcota bacterium]|nr:HDOD domain-containing protein [Myxococcota bacterium]